MIFNDNENDNQIENNNENFKNTDLELIQNINTFGNDNIIRNSNEILFERDSNLNDAHFRPSQVRYTTAQNDDYSQIDNTKSYDLNSKDEYFDIQENNDNNIINNDNKNNFEIDDNNDDNNNKNKNNVINDNNIINNDENIFINNNDNNNINNNDEEKNNDNNNIIINNNDEEKNNDKNNIIINNDNNNIINNNNDNNNIINDNDNIDNNKHNKNNKENYFDENKNNIIKNEEIKDNNKNEIQFINNQNNKNKKNKENENNNNNKNNNINNNIYQNNIKNGKNNKNNLENELVIINKNDNDELILSQNISIKNSFSKNNKKINNYSKRFTNSISKNGLNHITLEFKIVLLGSSGVGKTGIFNRYMTNAFSENYECTINVTNQKKKISLDDKTIAKLSIWDTAGEEKYSSITRQYLKQTNGAIIVYDITDRSSYDKKIEWIDMIKNENSSDIVIMLVGNKIDLDKRVVSENEAKKFCHDNQYLYLEVSAKEGTNINLIFEKISSEIDKKREKEDKNDSFFKQTNKSFEISKIKEKEKKNRVCC